MNTKHLLYFFALMAVATPVGTRASSVSVTDFRDIRDSYFLPIEGSLSGSPRVWDLGPVSISSPGPSSLGSLFSFDALLTGPDPSGIGFLSYHGDRAPAVFNLSQPVAALGVTFGFAFTRNNAILKVYDGYDATGNLVGSVVSPQIFPRYTAQNRSVDFVAVVASDTVIKSFSIGGEMLGQGATISGFAVSFAAVPEPTTPLLTTLLLIGVLSSHGRRVLLRDQSRSSCAASA